MPGYHMQKNWVIQGRDYRSGKREETYWAILFQVECQVYKIRNKQKEKEEFSIGGGRWGRSRQVFQNMNNFLKKKGLEEREATQKKKTRVNPH